MSRLWYFYLQFSRPANISAVFVAVGVEQAPSRGNAVESNLECLGYFMFECLFFFLRLFYSNRSDYHKNVDQVLHYKVMGEVHQKREER